MSLQDDDVRERTVQLVGSYLALVSQRRFDEWIELWADDGVLDFPFAPGGRQGSYRGKQEILAYMSATPGKLVIDSVDHQRIHPMHDPEVAVVEFTISGRAVTTDLPYNQSYVMFFETSNGKLKRYREYWNPLVSIDAFGGREAWTAGFGSPQTGATQ